MKFLLAFLTLLSSALCALAQPAMPTYDILSRILMIQSQYDRGTVFSIDVDGREYWITAKHILTGAQHPPYGAVPAGKKTLKVLNPGGEGERWIEVEFSIIDVGADIDEVVLAASTPLLNRPLPAPKASLEGVILGADCSFLGFPYGGSWRAKYSNGQSYWMPFTKRCSISAFDGGLVILDGINNFGFSGGPVLVGTGPDQRIIAVISGYRTEPVEVLSSGAQRLSPPPKANEDSKLNAEKPTTKTKQSVYVNSGFIIAYGIIYATDAIRKNPIGPLRETK